MNVTYILITKQQNVVGKEEKVNFICISYLIEVAAISCIYCVGVQSCCHVSIVKPNKEHPPSVCFQPSHIGSFSVYFLTSVSFYCARNTYYLITYTL